MITQLFPVGAIIAAIAIVFGYVLPAYSGSIAATKATIAKQDSALEAAKGFRTKENQLASERNAIAPENLERLDLLLPSSVNSIEIILDLNTLAAQTGIKLSNINATTPPQDPSLPVSEDTGKMSLRLSAAGSYQSFRAFLSALEHSARILDIKSFSLKSSDTGVYTYELALQLYWLH